ncbi:MAG: OPT/YSL family transporter, partial [Pyrinomonadaceae bacterium]
GSGLMTPLAPEQAHLIREMSVSQIQRAYILYIGAGAVAAGGIISLFKSLPTIWSGLKGGISDLRATVGTTTSLAPRTDRDISMKIVVGGIIAILLAILVFRTLHMNLFGALLIVICGFLFVTVSSRLTGEVGSTSNPISGMTVATLLLTSLAFLLIGWTAPVYYVTALSVGGIVCIASSNGGTTSQDLKTGFLIGSTPKYQQIAILIGALASALVLGPILLRLDSAATVYVPIEKGAFAAEYKVDPSKLEMRGDAPKLERIEGPQASTDSSEYHVWFNTDTNIGPAGRFLIDGQGTPVYLVDPGINGTHVTRPDGSTVEKYLAPKATLMSYIIKGILNRQLPWGLVLLGVLIAVLLELSGISTLAFAVGVYLPISTSCPIYIGGLIRKLVDINLQKKFKDKKLTEDELNAEGDKSPGVLLASGYVAGGALAGIVIAFMAGVLKD